MMIEDNKGIAMSKIKALIKGLGLVASIGMVQLACAAVQLDKDVATDAEHQKRILYYINEYRVKHHLSPLKMNNAISEEAAKHSRAMASKTMPFGHNDFNGRIKRLYKKIALCRGGAENVAYYRIDDKKLVDGWIASSGHRQNIVGNYNLTGIGIAHGKTGWAYYTQIFLRSDSPQVG